MQLMMMLQKVTLVLMAKLCLCLRDGLVRRHSLPRCSYVKLKMRAICGVAMWVCYAASKNGQRRHATNDARVDDDVLAESRLDPGLQTQDV